MGDSSSLPPHLPWSVPTRWPMPSAFRVLSAASCMPAPRACFEEEGVESADCPMEAGPIPARCSAWLQPSNSSNSWQDGVRTVTWVLEVSSSLLAAWGGEGTDAWPRGASPEEGLPPHQHLRERESTRESPRSPDSLIWHCLLSKSSS